MQSILITLCCTDIVVLIVGVAGAIAASSGQGDAAGRAMGTAYMVIGVIVLLILFVLPALWLASTGHALWLAMILSGLVGVPALVLFIGGIVAVGGLVSKRLRRR